MRLSDRVEELEERVAAIEARAPSVPVGASETVRGPDIDPDAFWALAGLRSRIGKPGAVVIVGDVVLPGGEEAQWQEGVGIAELLDDEWDRAADLLDALAHPVRLHLVRQVLRGASTARELGEGEGMRTSGQVYHHLRQLVAAGWLRNRGSRYEVPPERVVPLLTTVLGARR